MRDIGAQALQIVWRLAETDDPLGYTVTGTHLVERCTIEQCGLPRGVGRASFALSFFGKTMTGTAGNFGPRSEWDCPVLVKDTKVNHVASGYTLKGAIMAEWRPLVELLGGEIHYDGTADRDLCHFHNNHENMIDGTSFRGSHNIDFDFDHDFPKPWVVDVSNCQGSVPIRIFVNHPDGAGGTKQVKQFQGPVSGGVHWAV